MLDIKARDQKDRDIIIEMQIVPQDFFPKRVLYYWSKAYSRQLKAAQGFAHLKPVYSIDILDFEMIDDQDYRFQFGIYEKDRPQLKLTDDLEIHWIELPKFNKTLKQLESPEDIWIYLIKRTSQLQEAEMKAILDINPGFKAAFDQINYLSADEKFRLANEEYLDAERELISIKEQGIIEGEAKGKAEGKASTLVRQMKLRFAGIPPETEQIVMECKNIENLDQAADFILAPDCSVKRILEILQQK